MASLNLKDLSIISDIKSITLSDRQLCDIELILDRSFNPLTGFLNKANYESVLDNMRLSNNCLWPIPICLDLNQSTIHDIKALEIVALMDQEGFLIATLEIEDINPKIAFDCKCFLMRNSRHLM